MTWLSGWARKSWKSCPIGGLSRLPQPRQRDVGMIRARLQRKAAAFHSDGDLGLKLKQRRSRFDVDEEHARASKRVQPRQSNLERLRVQLTQFVKHGGEPVFGNFTQKDEGEVDVLRRRPAGVGEVGRPGVAGKGLGQTGWDGQADKEAHGSD